MTASTLLQDVIDCLNANVFLREFSFAATEFRVPGTGEVELADHLVLTEDLALIFQLKERAATASTTAADLDKWFANKVLKQAKRQVRDTIQLLRNSAEIEVPNQRGHRVMLPRQLPERVYKLIVYRVPVPNSAFKAPSFYESKTAGFIHVLSDVDFLGVYQYLITPTEIADYLTFREAVLTKGTASVPPSEASLVGQYLADEIASEPNERFVGVLAALREDRAEWDLSYILENFHSRITHIAGGRKERAYYAILAEFASLSRADLREFKYRLRLSLSAVKEHRYERPYRIYVPRTGCGFLLIPLTPEMHEGQEQFLRNLTLASKYEQQAKKQIGLTLREDSGDVLIDWIFTDMELEPNPSLDEMLGRAYPFRKLSAKMLPRYLLDTEQLNAVLLDE